jgi:hypothetical protein
MSHTVHFLADIGFFLTTTGTLLNRYTVSAFSKVLVIFHQLLMAKPLFGVRCIVLASHISVFGKTVFTTSLCFSFMPYYCYFFCNDRAITFECKRQVFDNLFDVKYA